MNPKSYWEKLIERKFLVALAGSVLIYVTEPDPHARVQKWVQLWQTWLAVEFGLDLGKILKTPTGSPIATVTEERTVVLPGPVAPPPANVASSADGEPG